MKTNFIDEYVGYASGITDAPVEFHRFVGYLIVSTIINNQVWFPFGRKRLYPNLWIILLAPSGLYRKSTSSDIGRELLTIYNRKLVLPNEFSQEKLTEVLSQNSQGTFFFSEFLSFMGLLNRDYNAGCKAFLTEMYDCPYEWRRETVSKHVVIQNPFVNILSCTTLDWFLNSIKEGDIAGGFLARFIMIPGHQRLKTFAIPPYVDDAEVAKMVMKLKAINLPKGRFDILPEADKHYQLWYKKFEHTVKEADQRLHPLLIRLPIYLLKLAVIESIAKGDHKISQETIKNSTQMISWITTQLLAISDTFEFTKEGRLRQRILTILKSEPPIGRHLDSSPPPGFPRHALLRHSHCSLKQFQDAIDTLKSQNLITECYAKYPGSNKTGIFYRLLDTFK